MRFAKKCFPPSVGSTIPIFMNFQNFIAKVLIEYAALEKCSHSACQAAILDSQKTSRTELEAHIVDF